MKYEITKILLNSFIDNMLKDELLLTNILFAVFVVAFIAVLIIIYVLMKHKFLSTGNRPNDNLLNNKNDEEKDKNEEK